MADDERTAGAKARASALADAIPYRDVPRRALAPDEFAWPWAGFCRTGTALWLSALATWLGEPEAAEPNRVETERPEG